MKLYQYYEDYGRMGSIEGLLLLTDEQKNRYIEHTSVLWWDELLGKHSEGHFSFSNETLTEIEVPTEVCKILFDKLGNVLSGPFDLDYFEEQISENSEDEECDEKLG